MSEDDLKKLLIIKWCILESVRLRAPGVITRKVVKPVKILVSTGFVGKIINFLEKVCVLFGRILDCFLHFIVIAYKLYIYTIQHALKYAYIL